MLAGIRKGLNSFLVMALLGILIASFAIWGVGDVFRTPTLTVAQVGDTEIGANEFLREFEARVNSFRLQFGGEFDRQQARDMGLDRMVLGQLIARTAWDEEVRRMGLVGSDKKVAETLRGIESFQGLTGSFDRFAYEQALRRIGLNFKQFEASLASEVARSQLLDTISTTTPLPEAFVREIYRYRKEARTSRVLTISTLGVGEIDLPSQEALREYHDFNKILFMAPEYRNLSILILRPSDFAEADDITEEDLRAAYEERIDEYQLPENRTLQVVTFSDQQTAQDFYDQVSSGGNFEALADVMAGFAADELDIGDKTLFDLKSDYSEVVAQAVFDLELDGISQPNQTILGWYVFRVMEITSGTSRTFEQVHGELRDIVAGERGIDALYDTAAQIDDNLAEGATVEEIGTALELKVQTFAAIDRSSLDPQGLLVSGEPDILPYLQYAFSLVLEDETILMEDEHQTGFYLVQLNDVIEPALKPFETVVAAVRARWLAGERNKKAGELADRALQEAEAGVTLEELAERYDGQLIDAPLILRDEMLRQQVLAPNVANLVFSLQSGEVGLERAATGEGYVLVQVTSITSGDPDADPSRLAALRDGLQREFNADLYVQYQSSLQTGFGVTINQQLIDNLFDPSAAFGTVHQRR
jgi:peptidyl-prolyl cis-trans isomerase D